MNEKILLIQTAFLGDLILTTSFFREVKKNTRTHILRLWLIKEPKVYLRQILI
ncbi:hypothetical protein LEP1GSC151_2554 [Leptospira interrogans serovar Grippotyphosa str. LT2186]|uniref:Uncharacterized protein n=4 Tax=Leptospira interrogans TaxID=173 RepID=M3H8E3_LEPIR|nr:hypothetical protein LEP1GSC151_2554 [Leptospira interrogans serovar Grippotyphosa str. LT2186]EMM83743.1 hypothetical protein LEP1GSC037_4103 [Leptospira interrogans str. 2006001854]EMM97087.1 hypothetical protein LEP1GSC158_1102 [Leptospira interrogans serovar Zanoni str. LT2156]EMP04809.1 hypothetical protein LEP1GSC124_4725 [Leptospira interrogans serovar Pyrogenes str. 200701872]